METKYYEVPESKGLALTFTITVGLFSGYEEGKTFEPVDVGEAAHGWMRERIGAGLPILTGSFTRAEVFYAYQRESGIECRNEPVLKFSGEVVPLYNSSLKDEVVVEMLNDLAAVLGASTGQTRVYVRYRDWTWILQKEGEKTPREE